MHSQGTFLPGATIYGKLCVCHQAYLSTSRAQFVPATQADFLSVYILYSQGTYFTGRSFTGNCAPVTQVHSRAHLSVSQARCVPVTHAQMFIRIYVV